MTILTVPSDKRFVVDFASARATVDEDELALVVIVTTVGGVEASFQVANLVGLTEGAAFPFPFPAASKRMKVFADPETNVIGRVGIRNAPEEIQVCLSGRLLPLEVAAQ